MKIFFVGPAHPLRGGLATYNERLAREFISQGDEVTIYTFSLQYPSILFPGKSQYSSSPPPEDLDIRVKINSINPLNWVKVGREIKKAKPDILVIKYWLPFMGPCFGTIARIAKRNNHTKVITIVDNIIPHEGRPGDMAFTKYFIKPVNGFIAQSRSVEEDIKKFRVKQPVLFNPHPLFDNFGQIIPKKTAKAELGLDPEAQYMLFFGFIRGYKGLDIMLKAMAEEQVRQLKVKLIVAGEFYEDAKPYHNLIAKHKIEDAVVLHTDFIPDEKVSLYFSAADVVVQPYKSATQSGVTQIGYHFNKPMIVTKVGGLPEIIPDGKVGYVVEPEPKALAGAIHRFYAENKEAEFSKNAATEKEKYSWAEMVNKIKKLAK